MSLSIEVGSIVEGKVIKIKPFGAIVSLPNGSQGLVHISQVANGFVQDINDHVKIDDVVKVKILSIDTESNKIALSMREALPPAPKPQNRAPREGGYKKNYENRSQRDFSDKTSTEQSPTDCFEDKMKEWLKQSNERQSGLNKRINRRQ